MKFFLKKYDFFIWMKIKSKILNLSFEQKKKQENYKKHSNSRNQRLVQNIGTI